MSAIPCCLAKLGMELDDSTRSMRLTISPFRIAEESFNRAIEHQLRGAIACLRQAQFLEAARDALVYKAELSTNGGRSGAQETLSDSE